MDQGYSPSGFQGQGRSTNNQQNGSSPNTGAARKTAPLRPVSIHMLNSAQSMADGVITIQGREVNQVVVLGQVVEYVETAGQGQMSSAVNMHGYRISDSTGLMTVKQWFEPGNVPPKAPINSYIRAVGSVKNFKGEYQISGQISAVASCDEVQYHFMDILSSHLRLTRGNKTLPKYMPKQQQQQQGLSPQGTMAAPMAGGMMSPSGGGAAGGPATGAFGGMPPMAAGMVTGMGGAPGGGASPIEMIKRELLAAKGVAVAPESLAQKTGIPLTDIRSNLNSLVMDGTVTDQGTGYAIYM